MTLSYPITKLNNDLTINKQQISSLRQKPKTAHFRISHEKTLDGNGKMSINVKNVHKKRMRTFE